MRIVIGETTNRGATQYRHDMEPLALEAKLLSIRDKRDNEGAGEPASARVVTLLVPEGQKIPRGVESGEYRIHLRFVHRRHPRF